MVTFRPFLPPIFICVLALAACSGLLPPPTPTPSPLVAQGKRVFNAYCSRCHESSNRSIIVGPSLAGIASRAESRIPGMDAEAYIRDSIMSPMAYTVEGFAEGTMPESLKDELSAQDLEAVIAFLLTLE
ncbi:MAG: cytochrome c [Candidatus Promineifilaceae bacterium]|nr:cytochrome c [Candidatus Promineifilaceae bacterium]